MAVPEVEHLSSTLDAQSASQNAQMAKGFFVEAGYRSRP